MNREKFIQIAGGVHTSTKYYSSWSGSEKAEHFWNFFDDNPDEYIHSVYAGVTVDILRRKRMYSIEHIIPKSFLKKYRGFNSQVQSVV